jgi:hypothetical protein
MTDPHRDHFVNQQDLGLLRFTAENATRSQPAL